LSAYCAGAMIAEEGVKRRGEREKRTIEGRNYDR
jgi:hypothetical protein